MTSILTELTNTAVNVFKAKNESQPLPEYPFMSIGNSDAVLKNAHKISMMPADSGEILSDLMKLLFGDQGLQSLMPIDGELDPMILHPGGGMRTSAEAIVTSIFSSAFLHMYYLRFPYEESVYVRTVIENFEELKRATQGEKVRSYTVKGLAGISLKEGSQISTPWGIIRPAPQIEDELPYLRFDQPKTNCILAEQKLIPIVFDRAPSPERDFSEYNQATINSDNLLQLTYALSSPDPSAPIAPLLTWSTTLLPFQAGFAYNQPRNPSPYISVVEINDQIEEVEEWARIINNSHSSTIDISAQRLVSAIVHRSDKSDALIDSVMVWENLLGTHNEVTFRVSAALSMLIEGEDNEKRQQLYKELKSIYGLRSRIVHGASVDATDINKACEKSIEVAIRALKISYKKGNSWLAMKSSDRSDNVLLQI